MAKIEIEIEREGGSRETFKNCSESDLHLVINALRSGEIKAFYAVKK